MAKYGFKPIEEAIKPSAPFNVEYTELTTKIKETIHGYQHQLVLIKMVMR